MAARVEPLVEPALAVGAGKGLGESAGLAVADGEGIGVADPVELGTGVEVN